MACAETDARLHCEIDGRVDRPPLVLLHGFLSSNLQWEPNRAALRRHFRVIAVELWGHGRSPAPQDPACYRVDRYVAELERIRREIAVERWLVCGQSFGAGIAIRYALAHPEATRGLVITNSRSALNDVSGEPTADLAAWQTLDPRRLPFHPCHAERFPEALKARMEETADRVSRYALWQATATTLRDLSCRAVVARLRVPTLLANGRYERRFQADRDFAAAAIPGLEIVDLPAGHSVNIEAAAGFDAALNDFARRHA